MKTSPILVALLLSACGLSVPEDPKFEIKPDAPKTLDELTLEITETEGVNYTVSWLRDGRGLPELSGSDIREIPADQTARDEVWTAVVVAEQNGLYSEQSEKSVTIQNTPPSKPTLTFNPLAPSTLQPVRIHAESEDDDGDPVSFSYQWLKDDELQPEFTEAAVDANATHRDEIWTVEVVASDGDESSEKALKQTTIGNSAPEILSVTISPDTPGTSDHLEVTVEAIDTDEDSLTYQYNFSVDGNLFGWQESNLFTAANFQRGSTVLLDVVASDGFLDSNTISTEVIIANTPPTATAVVTGSSASSSDTSTLFTDSIISCNPGHWSDPDTGDPMEWTIAWKVNGQDLFNTAELLDAAFFNEGDVVQCVGTPSDGIDQGEAATSNAHTIENAPPVFSGLALHLVGDDPTGNLASAQQLTEAHTLVPYLIDSLGNEYLVDADGDSVSFSVSWCEVNTNGNCRPISPGTPLAELNGDHFQKEDELYAVIDRVWDDQGAEAHITSTPNTDTWTVINAPPQITSIDLDQNNYQFGETITAVVVVEDPDGDDWEVAEYNWYVDNTFELQTTIASTTPAYLGATKGSTVHLQILAQETNPPGEVSQYENSDNSNIVDTPPVASNASISGVDLDSNNLPRSNSELTCTFDLTDLDELDDRSWEVTWSLGGTTLTTATGSGLPDSQPTITSSTTLDLSQYSASKTDNIGCQATPISDGITGTSTHASVVLGNSIPVVDNLVFTPTSPQTDSTLSVNASFSDHDAQDTQAGPVWEYAWYVNSNMVSGQSGQSLDGNLYFDRGETVAVHVVASDGDDSSEPREISTVVANSAPQGVAALIKPQAPVEGQDDIVCEVYTEATDLDTNDTISYDFSWRINEVNGNGWREFSVPEGDDLFDTNYPNDSVDASGLFEDEVMECTITASDPQNASVSATATVTPIGAPCGSGAASLNSATASGVDLDGGTSPGGLDFGDFTIESWINQSSPPGGMYPRPFIGALGNANDNWSIGWVPYSQVWYFRALITATNPNTGANSTIILSPSEAYWPQADGWHHVALSGESESDGTLTYRLFMDGRLVVETNRVELPSTISNPIQIGKVGGSGSWKGKVDEVRISDAAIYTSDFEPEARFGVESDTLALYHLDDGSGTTATNSVAGGNYGNGTVNPQGSVSWSSDSVCDNSGDIAKIVMGPEAGCWLTQGGEIDCWGLNRYPDELLGSTDPADIANGVVEGHPTGSGYQDIDVDYYHACAVNNSGAVECWGDYENHQRGGSAYGGMNSPPTTNDFQSVALGRNHSCALRNNGTVYCWGWNTNTQIANTPATMTFSKISASWDATCGIQDTNGGLHCWGHDTDLMDATKGSPQIAISDVEITHSAAAGIKESDGQLVAWGHDQNGWNRTGAYPSAMTDPLPTIYGARAVGMSRYAGCVANATGQIDCWGHQGDNNGNPTKFIPGVYKDLVGAENDLCGLTIYGRVNCWGSDDAGETNPPIH